MTTGIELQVPVVFARKARPSTIGDDHYTAPAYSYTKQAQSDVIVAKQFISSNDRLLVIDDFLARGEALSALTSIVSQAAAVLVGIGIVIEKAFQRGGEKAAPPDMRSIRWQELSASLPQIGLSLLSKAAAHHDEFESL